MVYASDSGRAQSYSARTMKLGLMPDSSGDPGADAPPRDWKKLVIVVGLGVLSWVATYIGMLELIESNMGELPLVHKLIIAFSVAMLMTMIVWLLDQIFSPIGLVQRLCYIAGYIFLSVISVGFGFGFYWKVLESRSESSRSAEMAVTAVQSSLNAASTRLEQVNATLLQLATLSREKAAIEREKGTTCPNSKPGDGPRRRMRDEDATRFAFASDFVSGRVTAVKADITALEQDLARIADPSTIDPKTGTRNEYMKTLSRKLDMTVSGFNAVRTDPQLQELRASLSERADKTTFGDPKNGGFICPDVQLSQALRGAVRAINELPVLEKPAIAAVEGSEATIEAFRRLTATFYGLLSFDLPPSADELRELQKKAMQSVEGGPLPPTLEGGGGLTKRDYVPLAIAIFVDICLLLVSIGRPANRLHGLVSKMRDAERGPVIEILSRFNDIHRDQDIRENFELFRHVVFDMHGTYYVAVPLDAPPSGDPEHREEMRIEAQLLANLFTSFEKDRIFTRTWTPFTPTVKRKLRRQGSKFADVNAFRLYRFRDGAWSEIILGAVMGAARRAEAEEQRRRIEDGLRSKEALQTSPREPAFDAPRTPRSAPPGTPQPASPQPTREPDPSFAAKFGVHARQAEMELTTATPEPSPQRAANSNTAPSLRRAPAEPAYATSEPRARDPGIDVVLERETAKLTLPMTDTSQRDSIFGRISEALARAEIAAPTPEPRDEAQIVTGDFPEIEHALESDPETADAAHIAGRLRPAKSGDRS